MVHSNYDLFDKLIEKLLNISIECRKIQYNLPNNIEKSLKQFSQVLSKTNDLEKTLLKDTKNIELNKIHAVITKFSKLKPLYNKIFIEQLQYSLDGPLYISKLFEEFIKGITYFSRDKANPSIYHRLYECEPSDETYRNGNLVCFFVLNKKELIRRRTLIERCYIERLIYTEIYNKLYNNQNNHKAFKIDLTKKDFETCFPNTKINISIDYHNNLPMKLTIMKETQGILAMTTITTYEKIITTTSYGNKEYDDIIEVIKIENNKKYFKLSTFTNPGSYFKIN